MESIQTITDPQPMYNLTVAEANTFFVGEDGWLVHNIEIDVDWLEANLGVKLQSTGAGPAFFSGRYLLQGSSAYLEVDTIIAETSVMQAFKGLQTFGQRVGVTEVIVRAPSIINQNIIKKLLTPAWLETLNLQIYAMTLTDISHELETIRNDQLIQQFPAWKKAAQEDHLLKMDIMLGCTIK